MMNAFAECCFSVTSDGRTEQDLTKGDACPISESNTGAAPHRAAHLATRIAHCVAGINAVANHSIDAPPGHRLFLYLTNRCLRSGWIF